MFIVDCHRLWLLLPVRKEYIFKKAKLQVRKKIMFKVKSPQNFPMFPWA